MGKVQLPKINEEPKPNPNTLRSEGFYHCGNGKCPYKSERLGNVVRHQERMHSKLQKNCWSCGACKITFSDRWELQDHKKRIHNHGFKCTVPNCGWEFSRGAHLERHLATHTGSKKFWCSYTDCKYGSSTKYNLERHIEGVHKIKVKFHQKATHFSNPNPTISVDDSTAQYCVQYPKQSAFDFSNAATTRGQFSPAAISPANFYPPLAYPRNKYEIILPCPNSDCYCMKPPGVESKLPLKKSEESSSFTPFRPWESNERPKLQQVTTFSRLLSLSLCCSPYSMKFFEN